MAQAAEDKTFGLKNKNKSKNVQQCAPGALPPLQTASRARRAPPTHLSLPRAQRVIAGHRRCTFSHFRPVVKGEGPPWYTGLGRRGLRAAGRLRSPEP